MSLNNLPPCYAFIPARYGSTRFPGKALADILGKPMFFHVYKQAKKCPLFQNIILATDHELIAQKAQELNVPVVMTANTHKSGTDRILEAAQKLNIDSKSIVVNIQGDEPLLHPAMLEELLIPFKNPEVNITTLARNITLEEAKNPNVVKVVIDKNNNALYFSRSLIPYPREENKLYLGHIGLYAYRFEYLKIFTSLKQSFLEKVEGLEQLRLLENGYKIFVHLTQHSSFGVDTPEDLQKVITLMKTNQEKGE